MRQYLAGKIRNVAIAGHAGCGKTSLAEALLYVAKETNRLGSVDEGNSVFDFSPEEVKRGITISPSVYPFTWGSVKVNLVDTPGLFDFEHGVSEGIRAVENVIITVSGRSGVTVGAKKAYEKAVAQDKGRMIFINKLDSERADFYKVLEELKADFGPSICPLVVPVMDGHTVDCYVNLVDQKAYKYDEKGVASEVPMPDIGHRLEGLTNAISEAVAETSEELFDKFFSGEPFTRDEIISGIHEGVKSGSITPVLGGSATKLEGIDVLLDSISDHLSSAWESGSQLAVQGDDIVEIQCTDEAPLSAFIFKTIIDPFVGKLSLVKVVSGKLSAEKDPINARTNEPVKLGKTVYIRGKNQEDTSFITAGDIGAIVKISDGKTGDTICSPDRVVSFDAIDYPNSTLSMAIRAVVKGEEGKAAQGIQRLMDEDVGLIFEQNAETKEMLIHGLGEQHLDVVVSELNDKFGVQVELKPPRVPYREKITKTVTADARHRRQTGGHGQYGHVIIDFEPHSEDDFIFEETVFGGSVPRNYFPAVEKGLEESLENGVLAGYPMVGLKATLKDGSYHAVDSSEMAFKIAANMAYRDSIPKADPILLEPISEVKVLVEEDFTGDVMGELTKRRGRILGMEPKELGKQEIVAEVPMSEMAEFTNVLRSITQGSGEFSMAFVRYEPLPKQLEADVIADAKAREEEENS